MDKIDPAGFQNILFFTGAGMSAESGIPTYRGSGGVWHEYNWEEYACQAAFNRSPEKVLNFHELRRTSVLGCKPHQGHFIIAKMEEQHPGVTIVTQNIDGMHQRAGNHNVIELHGSLWRVRCPAHGISEDMGEKYTTRKCPECDSWIRPDITWFSDMLNEEVINNAVSAIEQCDLFISIGTSGVVWPAAGFPQIAKEKNAFCIEINPEASDFSGMYDINIREPAGKALPMLFKQN